MRDGWVVGESVKFTIPSLPPSKNLMHEILRLPGRPLIFKRSKAHQRWLNEAMPYIKMLTPSQDSFYFKVDAVFQYPFHHANGKMKRKDAHNFLEALCDAIATKNGFDDSYIKFGSWEAYDSDREQLDVMVSQVKEAKV